MHIDIASKDDLLIAVLAPGTRRKVFGSMMLADMFVTALRNIGASVRVNTLCLFERQHSNGPKIAVQKWILIEYLGILINKRDDGSGLIVTYL